MKGLLLIKCTESSAGREEYVLELLMSGLFDMLFWIAGVRMSLHMLVFVCPCFALCKGEVIQMKRQNGNWEA